MKALTAELVFSVLLYKFCQGSVCDVILCGNGGSCVAEEFDFSEHQFIEYGESQQSLDPLNDEDVIPFHCECPSNWTGRLCDISFMRCSGTHNCYNGGSCIRSDINACDCSLAEKDGYKYEGRFCEHRVASLRDYVTGLFESCPCVNGGVCIDPLEENPTCYCPTGYSGRFCEFENSDGVSCDLPCENGGYCVFSGVHIEQGSYQACNCPDTFAGALCEIEGAIPCGDIVCYNEAVCVRKNVQNDIANDHCDCRTAVSSSGKRVAGQYCQYEETASCDTSTNVEARLFCVNEGQCKEEGLLGCDCPEGYSGFSCEFFLGTLLADPSPTASPPGGNPSSGSSTALTCTLECGDHGVCRNGMKDVSGLGDASDSTYLSKTHENLEHCVCEEGFTGLYCDRVVNVCLSGIICLHSGECQVDEQGQDYCDCSTSHDTVDGTTKFFGPSCEYPITSYCSLGSSDSNVCVNGGECKELVPDTEAHPGCVCPDGWSGNHCEISTIPRVCTKGGSPGDQFSHTCYNGGKCLSLVDPGDPHPGCECIDQWTGISCEETNSTKRRKRAATLFPLGILLVLMAGINAFVANRWAKSSRSSPGNVDRNLAPMGTKSSFEHVSIVCSPANSNRDPMAHIWNENRTRSDDGSGVTESGFALRNGELL